MPRTDNLREMFGWLTRNRLGPKFGTMAIGPYQYEQMCGVDAVHFMAKRAIGPSPNGDYEVKISHGNVLAKRAGSKSKFERIGTEAQLRNHMSRCVSERHRNYDAFTFNGLGSIFSAIKRKLRR